MILIRITQLFPVWALVASALALLHPHWFTGLKAAIVPLLGLVMFGMGMSLTPANFAEVLRRPRVLALGVFLQFLLMPLLAWGLAAVLALPPYLAAGLILVGSCPGGTASNVICYLARGDVALSITLTTLSTLLAVFLTPLLTWAYVGQSVPVPVWDMLLSILKMVIVPVLLGVALNRYWGPRLGVAKRVFPLVSVFSIVVIIAIIVALNEARLQSLAWVVGLAVVSHNLLGLLGGYWLARALRYSPRIARTLSIEVGMQNSGLGVALAVQYLTPLAALPGALFSIWHNLAGSAVAAVWARKSSTAPEP